MRHRSGNKFARGDRVRALREGLQMTQRDLSIKTGISQGHLSNLENGNVSEIGSGSLYALSRALRTNMPYLTGTGGDPRPRDKAKLGDLEFDEAEVLTNYQALKTKHSRAIIRQVLEGLVRAEKESPPDSDSGR